MNRSAMIAVQGKRIRLVGMDDLVAGQPSPAAAFCDNATVDAEIVLAHCPEHRDVLATRRSLMLSGHTHGGQVNLFGMVPWLPRGSGRFVRGWYGVSQQRELIEIDSSADLPVSGSSSRTSSRPLYVSRGLGTSIAPVRFGSVPELARFELLV